MSDPICFLLYSLSPTPQASITSLVEAGCEPPNISDESQRKLCNSPRNNTNTSQSIKRDSPPPSIGSIVDEVKKLEIRTSNPGLSRRHKTNSPLASSSNLSKPDPTAENLRLSSNNNNENNSRKSEVKWHCSVRRYHVFSKLALICTISFRFLLDVHLRKLSAQHKMLDVWSAARVDQQSKDHNGRE